MRRAQRAVTAGRGRLFDDLLMAALHRTVSLAELQHLAVAVGEHLDLDMARRCERALDQQPRIAERGLCLGRAASSAARSSASALHQPHAAPAAAGRRLHSSGNPMRDALAASRVSRLIIAVVAGHHRHAERPQRAAGARLVAHRQHRGRRRPDPHEAGFDDGLRERQRSRQESRSPDASHARRCVLRHRCFSSMSQVRVGGPLAADHDQLSHARACDAVAVSVGCDRDRAQAEPLRFARFARRSRRGSRSAAIEHRVSAASSLPGAARPHRCGCGMTCAARRCQPAPPRDRCAAGGRRGSRLASYRTSGLRGELVAGRCAPTPMWLRHDMRCAQMSACAATRPPRGRWSPRFAMSKLSNTGINRLSNIACFTGRDHPACVALLGGCRHAFERRAAAQPPRERERSCVERRGEARA